MNGYNKEFKDVFAYYMNHLYEVKEKAADINFNTTGNVIYEQNVVMLRREM